ncbi:hypothetical protein [Niallia sp. Krafla_26]
MSTTVTIDIDTIDEEKAESSLGAGAQVIEKEVIGRIPVTSFF